MEVTKRDRNKEFIEFTVKMLKGTFEKGKKMYKGYIYNRNEKRYKKYQKIFEDNRDWR